MKAKVIDNICIGCGACQAIIPDEFEINDEGIAQAKNEVVNKKNEADVIDAKENCPTGAIAIEE